MGRHSGLPNVSQTDSRLRQLLGLAQGRQQDRYEQGNDCDNHQEFYQGKTAPAPPAYSAPYSDIHRVLTFPYRTDVARTVIEPVDRASWLCDCRIEYVPANTNDMEARLRMLVSEFHCAL
jgi:hypothetical protein